MQENFIGWLAIVDASSRDWGDLFPVSHRIATAGREEQIFRACKLPAPAEFSAFYAAELTKWPPILRAVGLKPQ